MTYGLAGRGLFGVVAEFEDPDHLLNATKKMRLEGYRRMDAYTPFPIEELTEVLGCHCTGLPWLVLIGGIAGAVAGYLLQYYTSVISYPINVGGRPLNSIPAFIPIVFELTILFAALTAVVGMLAINGLPRPYHPIFNVERFELASRDRFFLCVMRKDPKFDPKLTKEHLQNFGAKGVYDVGY